MAQHRTSFDSIFPVKCIFKPVVDAIVTSKIINLFYLLLEHIHPSLSLILFASTS